MSPAQKTLSGIAAFIPLISLVVSLIVFLSFFMKMLPFMNDYYEPAPEDFLPDILVIILVALIMSLVMLGVMVYFIIHCINNRYVRSDERIVWILVFIFAGIVGYPIYWFMRILKPPAEPVNT